MPKIAEAFVEISAKIGGLRRKLATSQGMVARAMRAMGAAAKKGMGLLASAAKRAFSSLIKWAKRALIALTALATYITVKAVKAWAIQEKAIASLAGALKGAGKHTEAGMRDLQDFASALQEVSEIGDETILTVMSLGASLSGMAGKNLKALTVAALGLSKVIGSDLKTAMMLLARATKGEFTLFSRYGIKLDETASAQEKFNSVFKASLAGLKIVDEQVGTLSGRWSQLKNAAGDALEQIGRIITTGAGGGSLADGVANITDRVVEWTDRLGGVPGVADKIVSAMKTAWTKIELGFVSMGATIEGVLMDLGGRMDDLALTLFKLYDSTLVRGLLKLQGITLPDFGPADDAYEQRANEREVRRLELQKKQAELAQKLKDITSKPTGIPDWMLPGYQAPPFFELGKGARPRASRRFGAVEAPTVTGGAAKAVKETAKEMAKALVTSVATALGTFKIGQRNRQEILAERSLRTEESMDRNLAAIKDMLGKGSVIV
jgi:hypothetical protein